MNSLIILQKKSINIINIANCNAHTKNLFFRNKILKLTDINLYLQAIHMYKSDKTNYLSSHTLNTQYRNDLIHTFQRTIKTQGFNYLTAPQQFGIKYLPTSKIFPLLICLTSFKISSSREIQIFILMFNCSCIIEFCTRGGRDFCLLSSLRELDLFLSYSKFLSVGKLEVSFPIERI